jgi:hypothetical protein
MVKPQDILVLLKLVLAPGGDWSYPQLAVDLGMSTSEVHAAVKRAEAAGLANKKPMGTEPVRQALQEFLIHAVKYSFVPKRGGLVRGIPTAHAAPPLNKKIVQPKEPPPVWPHPQGTVRGVEFSPLYRSAPDAALKDTKLYEMLALVDAIRGGRSREQKLAISELDSRLARTWI